MPVIQRSTTIGAASSNDNVIAGSAFEFARTRQIVSIGCCQSATGLFVMISSGADVIAEEFEPVIKTSFPIIPDEMYYTDVMEAGDRLVIRARNSTAGALVLRTIVQISAFGG